MNMRLAVSIYARDAQFVFNLLRHITNSLHPLRVFGFELNLKLLFEGQNEVQMLKRIPRFDIGG